MLVELVIMEDLILSSYFASLLEGLVFLLLLELLLQLLRVDPIEHQGLVVGHLLVDPQVSLTMLQDLGELRVIHLHLVVLQDCLIKLQYRLVVLLQVIHSSRY